jgi:hypothetical protein
MMDVRAWTLLLVAIGIAAIVWLNRMIVGAQPERAFWASVMAALPGGCYLLEMWLFRGRQELFELFFFGPALVWIVIGFIALIKSFKVWPLSEEFSSYQILRILNATVWAASSFFAWLGMIYV